MNIYDLDKRGNMPIYEYLYNCIKKDILSGHLEPEQRLLSKRTMSKIYDIAVITVENAYAQLLVEGYIYGKQRSGYYVSDIAARLIDLPAPSVLEDFSSYEATDKPQDSDIIDLSAGALQRDAFPFASWAKLSRKILLDEEKNLLSAPHPQGVYALRRSICNYLSSAKGLYVKPDNIIVGPGSEYLHQIIIQLIGKSCIVATEDPGYKKVSQIYSASGVRCLHIPVDHKGLVVSELSRHPIRLVHTSPAHHFPTGRIMTIDRRYELINWARESDSYIIEDDYDSEFRLSGRPIPTLASLSQSHTIYMNTFTRSMAPAIRIAYIVLPDRLIDIYRQKLSFYSGTVSAFDQYILSAFMDNGYFERHISRMRTFYRKLRNDIIGAFNESGISKYAALEEEHAGLHFILRITSDINDETFIDKLSEYGIALRSIKEYCHYPNDAYNHCFIVNYGTMNIENFKKALNIIKEILDK